MLFKKLTPLLLLVLAACECSDDACQMVETNAALAPGTAADFQENVADTVYFAFNKANISPSGHEIVKKQSKWLESYPATTATVEGHCDSRGSREYNLALGEKRANNVKSALLDSGVAADRLSSLSYGKDKLKLPDATTEDEHAQNRRGVTIIN